MYSNENNSLNQNYIKEQMINMVQPQVIRTLNNSELQQEFANISKYANLKKSNSQIRKLYKPVVGTTKHIRTETYTNYNRNSMVMYQSEQPKVSVSYEELSGIG